MCFHVLFVILKVLKVPNIHPLSFQTSLTDSEVSRLLSGSFEGNQSSSTSIVRRVQRSSKAKNDEQSAKEIDVHGFVTRQELNDEEGIPCPICQDDIKAAQALTWCRKGCGNNIHAKCMQNYAQYKMVHKEVVGCPLCREEWTLDLLQGDCRGGSTLKHSCVPVYCVSCSFPVRAEFNRCLECSQTAMCLGKKPTDFCMRCFSGVGREHATHHFVASSATVSNASEVVWTPTANPRASSQGLGDDVIASLQQRELGVDDYETLLDLDQSSNCDLPTQLLLALPNKIYFPAGTASADQPIASCWCSRDSRGRVSKILPCGHTCHEDCLKTKMSLTSGINQYELAAIVCGHVDCRTKVFPALIRRRKRSKKVDTVNESTAVVVAGADSGMGGTIGLVSVTGTGLGAVFPVGVRGMLRRGRSSNRETLTMRHISNDTIRHRRGSDSNSNSSGGEVYPEICMGIEGCGIVASSSSSRGTLGIEFMRPPQPLARNQSDDQSGPVTAVGRRSRGLLIDANNAAQLHTTMSVTGIHVRDRDRNQERSIDCIEAIGSLSERGPSDANSSSSQQTALVRLRRPPRPRGLLRLLSFSGGGVDEGVDRGVGIGMGGMSIADGGLVGRGCGYQTDSITVLNAAGDGGEGLGLRQSSRPSGIFSVTRERSRSPLMLSMSQSQRVRDAKNRRQSRLDTDFERMRGGAMASTGSVGEVGRRRSLQGPSPVSDGSSALSLVVRSSHREVTTELEGVGGDAGEAMIRGSMGRGVAGVMVRGKIHRSSPAEERRRAGNVLGGGR